MPPKKGRYGFEYDVLSLSTTFGNARAHFFSGAFVKQLPASASEDFKRGESTLSALSLIGFDRVASRIDANYPSKSIINTMLLAREIVSAAERNAMGKLKSLSMAVSTEYYLYGTERLRLTADALRSKFAHHASGRQTQSLTESVLWLEQVNKAGIEFLEAPVRLYPNKTLDEEALAGLADQIVAAVREQRTEQPSDAIMALRQS